MSRLDYGGHTVSTSIYSPYVLFCLTNRTSTEHTAIIHRTGTFGIDESLIPCWSGQQKGKVAMFTVIAILTFTGAFGAAGFGIYATVAPALSKIQAALAGHGGVLALPSLPSRRVSTLRVTIKPVAQPSYWRAAA